MNIWLYKIWFRLLFSLLIKKDFLAQAIESVMEQKTSFPIEIIVGEENLGDKTKEIAKIYAQKYPRKIKLISSRNDRVVANKSPGRKNFLRCFRKIKGKYFAILEGDDFWADKNKLASQVAFLESHADSSACFHRVTVVDKDGKRIRDKRLSIVKDTCQLKGVLTESLVHVSSAVFRNISSVKFPGWFEDNLAYGDWILTALYAQGDKMKYFDRSMSAYRIHSGGAWSLGKQRAKKERRVVQLRSSIEFLEYFREYFGLKWKKIIEERMAKDDYAVSSLEAQLGQLSKARLDRVRATRLTTFNRQIGLRGQLGLLAECLVSPKIAERLRKLRRKTK